MASKIIHPPDARLPRGAKRGGGERRADGEEREAGRTKGMKKRETTTRAADRQ